MVWQYTEYEGNPYLTDWVNSNFKFGIENQGRVTGSSSEQLSLPSGETTEAILFQTDRHLLPFFHMKIGSNKKSIFNLKLVSRGLVRELWTLNESLSVVDGVRIINYQTTGYGKLDDFKSIGKYAVKRLPMIATEIVLPPERFPNDVPIEEIGEIQQYRDSCLSIVNWEKTQLDICHHFFNYFIVSMLSEVDKSGRLRRKRKPFSEEEQRQLKELVEPLNLYKQ